MVRDQNTAGLTLFAVAGSWGQVAFFGFIGIVLFAFSGSHALGPEVLGGVVLVVLYIMTPLDVILTWLPLLGRAQVSLRRIEALGLSLAEAAGDDLDLPAGSPAAPGLVSEIALDGVTFAYDRRWVRPRAARPDAPRRGDRLPGRRQRQRQDDPGQAAGGPVRPRRRDDPGRRPAGRDPRRLEAYRQLFSVVFVDGHLFPTLWGLDRPGLDERGRDCARAARARRPGPRRGGGVLDDRAVAGPAQAARAADRWLEDRPIVVLDEWAANQDPEFKQPLLPRDAPRLAAAREDAAGDHPRRRLL